MRNEGDGEGLAAHSWWGVAAAVSAGALWLLRGAIAQHGVLTPIDERLPLVAVVLLVIVWLVREERLSMALTACVPLLAGAMAAFPQREGMRLLAYGVI
ncbi:MAG TPA: hypothetical protein VFL80_13450, partial [Thermoanaerobaculia bacterium]|nr:hypothetical protein [Thermoanaerobaculia bacterium]